MAERTACVSHYLTSAVPVAQSTGTVGDVLDSLQGRRFDSVVAVYVLDGENHLVGTVPLTSVYAARRDTRLDSLTGDSPPAVLPELDQEDGASLAIRDESSALPVVDAEGRFLGEFPSRAIMRVLRHEHLEDLHHMAGIWHHSEEAKQALQAPPLSRVRNRLPWLLLGLVGSLMSTGLVAAFEQTLQAQIAIAFFIPAIVYLADAVGTQSEAVAVRGLSLMTRTSIWRLLLGELSTGVLMGGVLALLAGLFAATAFEGSDLAFAVAVSILAACSVATSIGLLLPWAFARAGWDPAFASGPLATVVQDVLSLLIYFSAATVFMA